MDMAGEECIEAKYCCVTFLTECLRHHGHEEDTKMTAETCAIGERGQVS